MEWRPPPTKFRFTAKGSSLDLPTFERALHNGLGRVILFLQTRDAAPYRDLILYACLHNTSYDPQLDGLKTDYLMEIIDLTGERDFYRRQILDAAAVADESADSWDPLLLFRFVEAFALQGDAEARQLLYDYAQVNAVDEDSLGLESIVEIDGLEGLLFVLDLLSKKNVFPVEPDFLWSFESAVGGEEAAQTLLKEASLKHPILARYLRTREQADSTPRQKPKTPASYQEVRQAIETGTVGSGFSDLYSWRLNASDEELLEAARDLLAYRDQPERLRTYLMIFLKRPFPLDPSFLFSMLEQYGEDWVLVARLMGVLEQITHASVRTFALGLIEQKRWPERAVGLLARNFEPDDWTIIEQLSGQALDQGRYHTLGMSVLEVFALNPTTDMRAMQAMLNLYEAGPCSHCREQIIRQLQACDVLPEAIKVECRFDANLNIREWAEGGFRLYSSNTRTSDP